MKPTFEVKDLQHGDHVCLLYRSVEEQKNVVGPFIKEGLQRGELCLYIADEQIDPDLENLLAADGVDLLRLRQEGTLQVLNRYQVYLRYARFEPMLMREFYEHLLLQESIAGKYSGMRIIADMTWALSIGCEQLIPFEALLNELLPRWNLIQLCQYDLGRFAPRIVQDVLHTHQVAVVGEHMCPNFYYESSEFVLGKPDAKAKLQWMMNMLKKASTMGKACRR